ncbi:hypothetical protein GZH53_01125 [Flavihumibacter sp. R14]|nr:hypothetical protein [Flavihumibacter soli]
MSNIKWASYDFIYMKLTLLLSFTLILSACNDSRLAPQFKVSKDSIYADIHKIVKTESIFIEGYKAPVDDTYSIILTIQLINAKQLPKDNDSIMDIQKKVAIKVKSFLKNHSQFREYHIGFVQKDTTKTILGTATKEEGFFDHRFNVDDL